jgi:hypothetical protein
VAVSERTAWFGWPSPVLAGPQQAPAGCRATSAQEVGGHLEENAPAVGQRRDAQVIERGGPRHPSPWRSLFSAAVRCPLWVISGHRGMSDQCPLYPRKRTLRRATVMSALCQKPTPALQQLWLLPLEKIAVLAVSFGRVRCRNSGPLQASGVRCTIQGSAGHR